MRNALGLLILLAPAVAGAGYVEPQLGGGSPGVTAAMKHADITLEGNALVVNIDESVPTPRLRPLVAPDAFDPQAPWSVLTGRAYNAQYGWNPGGFIRLTGGLKVWIERLDGSPGLDVYQEPIDANGYAPLFGTDGSPARWAWSGRMTHNLYAAADFTHTEHWASYRVYVGDELTGAPAPDYTPAEVTFAFAPPGDYDDSGVVDTADHSLWRSQYGATGVALGADGNGDGRVDAADYTVWRDASQRGGGLAVPEPTAAVLTLLAFTATRRRAR